MTTDASAAVPPGIGGEVGRRVDGLESAARAATGRLPDSAITPAIDLATRARERLARSSEHTLVALAGATGSGKSSLFNALADLEIAGTGVRRPTTSWALACAWGPAGAGELLEWIGIPARHQVSRMSMLDGAADDQKLDGLILLDLPDHDSTEVEHHVEMDRLVRHADLIVWVLDPQKYADAAIHERYIRPMSTHKDVTLVVLNQLDRIHHDERARALDDVRRILDEAGLQQVPLLGLSATRGDGVDDLKRELHRRISEKASARSRLTSDIETAAAALATAGGTSNVPGVSPVDRSALDLALLDGAGVPQLSAAVGAESRRRAARATGWPLTRWATRLREEPLDRGARTGDAPTVQTARVEGAIRDFADKAAVGLERPWRDAIRVAATEHTSAVIAGVDQIVKDARTESSRRPGWWSAVNVLQWLALLALLGGAVWFGLDLAGVTDAPELSGRPLPLLVALAGLVAGIAFAVGSRLAARAEASGRSRRLLDQLDAEVTQIAEREVVAPVQTELDAYELFRAGLARATGAGGARAAR